MSGPKEADVRPKLEAALATIRRQQAQVSQTYTAQADNPAFTRLQASRQAAYEARQLAERPLPADAQRVAPWEGPQLTLARARCTQLVERAAAYDQQAQALREQGEALNLEADQLLAESIATCERIQQTLRQRAHYLRAEERQAVEARRQAERALANRTEAVRKLQQASDLARLARADYDAAAAVGPAVRGIRDRVGVLVAEAGQTQRARDEQEQRAAAQRRECEALFAQLGTLDHARFAPGQYDDFRRDVDRVQRACDEGRFARASEHVGVFLERLRQLVAAVQSQQAEWQSLQAAARSDREAIAAEVAALDRAELEQWSGEPEALAAAYAGLAAAEQQLAAEQFDAARQSATAAVTELRRLAEQARAQHARQDQRQEIATVVMQALYDLGYDTPCFQYARTKPAGGDDELSDLTIYANHPGRNGDMQMRIGLNGHVDLEVKDIPEGHEALCHQQLLQLQDRLGQDVDFKITNWGRAAEVARGAPPQETAAVTPPVLEQQREQVKERYHERGL
jgi:hypothetical protein